MLLDIILFIFLFYLSIPAVVGYFAKSYGRSFWLWFGIAFFLPIVSHLILYFLVSRDTKKNLVMTPREEASVMREVNLALSRRSHYKA